MYYKIISDNQVCYSKEIVKAYMHCGDDAVQRKVLDGSLKAVIILDRVVYAAAELNQKEIDREFVPAVQNVDEALKEFSTADSTLGLEHITYDRKQPTYKHKGFNFVKFNAVRSKSKYRDQFHLPVLEVCGTKYVALGCVKAGEGYIVD